MSVNAIHETFNNASIPIQVTMMLKFKRIQSEDGNKLELILPILCLLVFVIYPIFIYIHMKRNLTLLINI